MARLDGLQAFVAVAEGGSFRAAADRLGIARALVSKRIAALERGLGVRLLNRTTRKVSLTGPGLELLGRAQRIIADYDEAVNAVSHLQSAPAGRLRVGSPKARRYFARGLSSPPSSSRAARTRSAH